MSDSDYAHVAVFHLTSTIPLIMTAIENGPNVVKEAKLVRKDVADNPLRYYASVEGKFKLSDFTWGVYSHWNSDFRKPVIHSENFFWGAFGEEMRFEPRLAKEWYQLGYMTAKEENQTVQDDYFNFGPPDNKYRRYYCRGYSDYYDSIARLFNLKDADELNAKLDAYNGE